MYLKYEVSPHDPGSSPTVNHLNVNRRRTSTPIHVQIAAKMGQINDGEMSSSDRTQSLVSKHNMATTDDFLPSHY
jgi:hypothetical protein